MSEADETPKEPEDRAHETARDEEPRRRAPSEELEEAVEHLGRAVSSLRDRFLSDAKIQETAEKAREGTEKALREANVAIDALAADAGRSIDKLTSEAEKALREARQSAAPTIRAGLARLSSLFGGDADPLPQDPDARAADAGAPEQNDPPSPPDAAHPEAEASSPGTKPSDD